MKLLSIITKLPSYINDFYDRRPGLDKQPYSDQYGAIVNDNSNSFETWAAGMSNIGYQTERVYATIPQIQMKWAQEQGLDYDEANWVESIVKAQVKNYQPEIIIISKQSTFSPGFVNNLRSEVPALRIVISWCGSPYKDISIFREYDFILSCIPELVEDFNAKGHLCYHLNHAFDPCVLDKIDTSSDASTDFSFIGSIVKVANSHIEREALLIELVEDTDLEIWSPLKSPSIKQHVLIRASRSYHHILGLAVQMGLSKEQLQKIVWFRKFPDTNDRSYFSRYVDRRIVARAHAPVFGIPMYQMLRQSKVTLNTHIDISQRSASNMRLFEATGVGTCLLTDWKSNINDLYEADTELATYCSAEECIDKVRYLLEHEKERKAMAEAGQRRTLQDHTIYTRAEQLDNIIRIFLSSRN